jgi:hypothetical protein
MLYTLVQLLIAILYTLEILIPITLSLQSLNLLYKHAEPLIIFEAVIHDCLCIKELYTCTISKLTDKLEVNVWLHVLPYASTANHIPTALCENQNFI